MNTFDTCSEGGFITRCSPQRISNLKGKISTDKINQLKSYGFGGTLKVETTQIPFEFRRWLVDIYDVSSKTFILAPNMRLSLTEEDVQDVYGLPKGDKVIDLANLGPCIKLMNSLTSALRLKWNLFPTPPQLRISSIGSRHHSFPSKKHYCANWDTKKAKEELRAIQAKCPYAMNEKAHLVKALFGLSTEVDFTRMFDDQVEEMEKWIVSIRDKCNENLLRLHNLKRENIREGKRTEGADIQTTDDDSNERTKYVGLNDVPTSAEEEIISKVVSKGPLASARSSSGHNSKDSPVDKGPTVSEIAAETIQWMFPILHAGHYSMFIMNMKDKKYQFFDSRSTDGFKEQWLITGARIIKHWEGKLHPWMGRKWKDAEEIKGFKEVTFLDMFTNLMNKRMNVVLETGMVHYTVSPRSFQLHGDEVIS
ncbi:hypothetical protein LINPERHAP2_LOCUS5288 [Linum perenne]